MIGYLVIAFAAMDSGDTSEAVDLLRRIQQREVKAVEELYDKYAGFLNGLIRSIIRKPAEAEDLLQEVFTIIWEKASQFDPQRGSPRAWIITITKHKAYERLRSKRFKTQRKQSTSIDEQELVLDGHADSPLEHTIHSDEAGLIKQALQQIPENQRRMLHIAYYQDFTHREIAEKYDIPLGTVKSRIRRGMQKLKTIIETEFDYEHKS